MNLDDIILYQQQSSSSYKTSKFNLILSRISRQISNIWGCKSLDLVTLPAEGTVSNGVLFICLLFMINQRYLAVC